MSRYLHSRVMQDIHIVRLPAWDDSEYMPKKGGCLRGCLPSDARIQLQAYQDRECASRKQPKILREPVKNQTNKTKTVISPTTNGHLEKADHGRHRRSVWGISDLIFFPLSPVGAWAALGFFCLLISPLLPFSVL